MLKKTASLYTQQGQNSGRSQERPPWKNARDPHRLTQCLWKWLGKTLSGAGDLALMNGIKLEKPVILDNVTTWSPQDGQTWDHGSSTFKILTQCSVKKPFCYLFPLEYKLLRPRKHPMFDTLDKRVDCAVLSTLISVWALVPRYGLCQNML